jgi:hypothetical protein
MPDDDYENPDDEETPERPANADIRQLREKAKRTDELEARLAAVEREAAFTKAGIDPDDKRMAYFVKAYDGPTEADAIRTAATEAGFLNQSSDEPPPPDLTAQSRIAAASSGAGTPAPTNVADAISQAKTAEEVMAIVESEQAAAAGLRSVRQNQ